MAAKRGDLTVAKYLEFQIEASKKTQKEICAEIGYQKPNLITMFKQGSTKVPIHVAPKLAKSLGVDPANFTRMVIEEYMPELLPTIEKYIGGLASENEQEMLKVIRAATKDKDPPMDKDSEKSLSAWARGLI